MIKINIVCFNNERKISEKKLLKIEIESFEKACVEISKEDWYKREDFLHIKKDKIPTHPLRVHLSKIAANYFPSDGDKAITFPAVIVRRIATRLNLYVTDIIRIK